MCRICFHLVSPVAAHEAVRKVPVADVLRVVDGHDVPDVAPVYDLPDLDAGREVAHHMAHSQDYPVLLTRLAIFRETIKSRGGQII